MQTLLVTGYLMPRDQPSSSHMPANPFSPRNLPPKEDSKLFFSHQPLLTRLCASDQDVCIYCHLRFPDNAALRKHGEKESHRPYGCVCGDTFSRLDVLKRHISSKNKVNEFFCPLCERDAFFRGDHLIQHLKTFHKIPEGRIPEHFSANPSHNRPSDGDSIIPHQPMTRYPCPIQGCTKTAENAYLRQIDLDEHMDWAHSAPQSGMPVSQGSSGPASAWTNNGFQQDTFLQPVQTFAQYARQDLLLQPTQAFGPYTYQNGFSQPDPVRSFQADEAFLIPTLDAGFQGNF
ncbi:hypothetical protein ANO14919_042020 [Xylariales sp. No.14919]|nr:hypothetical protein ANO14919_042020 [Xylariales sp. No.14919]